MRDWGGEASSSSCSVSAEAGEASGDEGGGETDADAGGESGRGSSTAVGGNSTGLGGGGDDVALPVPPARASPLTWTEPPKLAPEAAAPPADAAVPLAAGGPVAAPAGCWRPGDRALSPSPSLSLSLLASPSLEPLMLPSRIRSSREGRALSRGRSPSMRA